MHHQKAESSFLNFIYKTVGSFEKAKLKYGITARAKDTIGEMFAENFTLYSAEKTKYLHKNIINFFNKEIKP